MLNYNLVLKSGEQFTAGEIETDGSRERATGFYARDTRHLERFEVLLDETTPESLSVTTHSITRATIICTNRLITRDDQTIQPQTLLVTQEVTLNDRLEVELTVQNFSPDSVSLPVNALFAADFRDIFDIRGFHRERRGKWLPTRADHDSVLLAYRGLDGVEVATDISYDQPALVQPFLSKGSFRDGSFLNLMEVDDGHVREFQARVPAARLTFDLCLEPGERWSVRFGVLPIVHEVTMQNCADSVPGSATISTGNPAVDRILDQSAADLAGLQTRFPHGSLPAAGIPWFVAPFGRDSLIASLQTLPFDPERAEATVRTLAALQGTRIDPSRDEEPGKILHEMRYGEMARIGEVPHSPYYGSLDATPLWLWLLAETAIWTGDPSLITDLGSQIDSALDWIEHYGDRDDDCLLEYRTDAHGPGRITHQVWKDSHDSLNHADGNPATGCIAPVEVQGYVFAAWSRLADALGTLDPRTASLRQKAEHLRQSVEDLFWDDALGMYVQALDGDKRPVAVASSNAGHLLACGLPSPERAARMVARFQEPDLTSGWGVRTLGSREVRFNPMSYHNGSIWPHDNSLVGYGMYRCGHAAAGHEVSRSLVVAATAMPLNRLPELYCGFTREGIALDRPVAYPVSCSPQAWAAGALPMLISGMLGLSVNPARRRLTVDPDLPEWLDAVTITGMRVLGQQGNLSVNRSKDGFRIRAKGLSLDSDAM